MTANAALHAKKERGQPVEPQVQYWQHVEGTSFFRKVLPFLARLSRKRALAPIATPQVRCLLSISAFRPVLPRGFLKTSSSPISQLPGETRNWRDFPGKNRLRLLVTYPVPGKSVGTFLPSTSVFLRRGPILRKNPGGPGSFLAPAPSPATFYICTWAESVALDILIVSHHVTC